MHALRASPYAGNTLVIFASDHGDGLGFHSNTSKGFLEEEAFRVPTIAWWPGRIPEGVRNAEHLISGVDIPATICDYAGAPPLPKATIARSWRPIFERRDVPWRTYVIGETSIGRLSVAVHRAHFREYISQIEMYPEPEINLDSLKRGNVYRDYIDWYLSVLNEA